MFDWLRGISERRLRTRCAKCGKVAAEARLRKASGQWSLAYSGIGGGTGGNFHDISQAQANKIAAAFARPYRESKFDHADLYDRGGFCTKCRKVYCWNHWSQGSAGPCPKGHFQSLDPHWNGGD